MRLIERVYLQFDLVGWHWVGRMVLNAGLERLERDDAASGQQSVSTVSTLGE